MRINDKRYTIRPEFCGYPTARYVVRFCGTWVGQRASLRAATILALSHKASR
jgi:hypothetical protein